MTVLTVTGHRPQRLTNKTDALAPVVFQALRGIVINHLNNYGYPELLICGGALGFDMAAASAAKALSIPYAVYVPFHGQESRWPKKMQSVYWKMLVAANYVVYVSEKFSRENMMLRNQVMVDRADCVLALYDGKRGGGTADCLAYAIEKGVPYANLWEFWLEAKARAGIQ
jgi:uncharacterized phage-like protein YoqJ